jgi:hypothetical protein
MVYTVKVHLQRTLADLMFPPHCQAGEGENESAVVLGSLGRVLINRDCSAIAGCRKRRVRIAPSEVCAVRSSGDLPPPSPPAEKAAARQD